MHVPGGIPTQTIFKVGDIIKNQYILFKEIGTGAFGAIFSVKRTENSQAPQEAMKLEKVTQKHSFIYNEVAIMQEMQGKPHFAKCFQFGTHQNYKFCTMELLGPSMIEIINRKLPLRFNLHDILKFGIQAIEALKLMHQAGFIHRDIKPGNFVIGNTKDTAGIFYLIDFGLCKRLPPINERIIQPQKTNNFRGTLRYASMNAHKGIELSPGDDILSLLFVMTEFFVGKLPWANCYDKDKVLEMKQQYLNQNMLNELPQELLQIKKHILQLKYQQEPKYSLITNILRQTSIRYHLNLNDPFEWESELVEMRDVVKQCHMILQLKYNEDRNKGKKQIEILKLRQVGI
ncbi:MAG: putative Tau-tubulin kinase 1 [Streblomastix strix]|uniref:non-specific serine/threonine protein kinase n=1 Tax=Streblomastix strix TaxID=222440 RepID=A0A5J4UVJ7_9EUKA|nr:MAG: putative Tau-tubulin kinase 1 [Streblomastix strix]